MIAFDNKQEAATAGYIMVQGPYMIRPGHKIDETHLLKKAISDLEGKDLAIFYGGRRITNRTIYIAIKNPARMKSEHPSDPGSKHASRAYARRAR